MKFVVKTMSELAPQILRFDSLPSTNLEAAKHAIEGAAEGLCVVASEQTAGRGRLQRQWISPKGAGLYFSILLRPRIDQSAWPVLTLMAAVAVHDALLDACTLDTDIKWPNDILSDNQKLCGILAETVDTPNGRAVVVGIGINLTSSAFPPELHEKASSVESATGDPVDLEVVLQALIRALERRYITLQSYRGVENVIRAWSERSSYAQGKRITVSHGDEILEGTTRGLESDGALRVETDAGEIKTVRAGDVTIVKEPGSIWNWLSKLIKSEPYRPPNLPEFIVGSSWEISPPKDFPEFLRQLPNLVPNDSTLCLEGTDAPDIQAYILARPALHKSVTSQGLLGLRPKILFMPVTIENLLGLADLAENHAEPEVCNTLIVFHEDTVFLHWHDVADDPFYVSTGIDEKTMKSVCDELGCANYVFHVDGS